MALRNRLQCTSFKAFLDSQFPGKFVPARENLAAWGQLRQSQGSQHICMDTLGHQYPGEALGTYPCHAADTPSQNQAFLLTKTGELRIIWDQCIDASGSRVVLASCGGRAVWEQDAGRLRHVTSGNCLASGPASELTIAVCGDSPSQRWALSGVLNG